VHGICIAVISLDKNILYKLGLQMNCDSFACELHLQMICGKFGNSFANDSDFGTHLQMRSNIVTDVDILFHQTSMNWHVQLHQLTPLTSLP
jgi:hypothetical protein